MIRFFRPIHIVYILLLSFLTTSFVLVTQEPLFLALIVPLYFIAHTLFGSFFPRIKNNRIRICRHGATLLSAFALSLPITIIYHIFLGFLILPEHPWLFALSIVYCYSLELLIFCNGFLCIYLTSIQMGVRMRVFGVLGGLIPFINVLVLFEIIGIVMDEADFELEKERTNLARKDEQVCRTKYPILLVHGVFFRDFKRFNYWGRIPKELQENGATVFYGEHESARSVAESGKELAARIKTIVEQTGCEKVNIIAHSKGGLDCRYALSELGIAPYVASLTTVNTPHRGCVFADRYLEMLPKWLCRHFAHSYNATLRKLGEKKPDFLTAVTDLTNTACRERNQKLTDPEGVFCQSIGSVLIRPASGKFPYSFIYRAIKQYDGINDGMVGESSFAWGQEYRLIRAAGKRGVSHADITDLLRENLPGFDVREYYVELLRDLKRRGL